MTDDLVKFLRARLEEDEQIARKAATRQPGGEAWTYEQPELRAASGLPIAKRQVPVLGEHIARHDPARVLRDVEAKRAILSAYERALAIAAQWGENLQAWEKGEVPPHPGTVVSNSSQAMEQPGLHAAMRCFAAVYAGHPDYREEWRP
ncbi:DUF6221 family protein [Streptomyces antimycoticus]|uniref:DUF6221 family protein n=1 Tax=Streptomyces antimycoticus TaxID=68175 RepID=UPI0033EAB2CE